MLGGGLEILDLTRDGDWCGREGLDECDDSGDSLPIEDGNGLFDAGLIRG